MNSDQEVDLVCIRHGRSTYNQAETDFFNAHPNLHYPEAQTHSTFRNQVLFSSKFIDTPLNDHGVQQCQITLKDQTLKQVDLVLVSPLTRALQSAQLIFGNNNIPFIAHPELSQSFRYSCDLSDSLDLKRAEFPKVDFTSVEVYGPHWEIGKNLGIQNQKVLGRFEQRFSGMSFKDQQKMVCQWLNLRRFYETNEELKNRSRRMREKLQEYGKRYRKIAVVSHLWAIRYLVISEFDANSYPLNVMELVNARPYYFSLRKLGLKGR